MTEKKKCVIIEMMSKFSQYKELIDVTIKLHFTISDKWKEYCGKNNILLFNQKKKLIKDIIVNEEIENAIYKYQSFLVPRLFSILKNGDDFRVRIKDGKSIQFKIPEYMKRKEEGKVPIQDCLNDIFGIRIITDEFINTSEIKEFIEKNYSNNEIKVIDSSKKIGENEYKATHLYFKNDNYSFRWELQVWFKDFVKSNEASHKKHKQAYTKWTKELKKEVGE
ncbi:MAG: hypothetical protein FWE22_04110 [Firmicutes bacterium]|nr:hypothetical protein [Bacillota bacterium]